MSDAPLENPALAVARTRVEALRRGLEAGGAEPVRLVETHVSWVLLTATRAYKLKKPLRLPFLDFSTLAARRHFCEEELRLNRRLAPTLYLDVAEVRDGPGGPSFAGKGPELDVAVQMRRFADGALWSEMAAAGTLGSPHIDAMARKICAFHESAAVAPGDSAFGSPDVHLRVMRRLVDAIDAWHAHGAGWPVDVDWPALRRWLAREHDALAPLWLARRRAGRVRECHGDLHLANALQLDAGSTAFDAIEFDPELRWIDVLDDIAFLAMDLMAHGLGPLASRWLDACLEINGDHDALPMLRHTLVSRALVRAQVGVLAAGQRIDARARPGPAAYLRLAHRLAFGADARLAITHGLPGSGKSHVSQALAEQAGAIRVRSDVERKRLFGLGALQSSRGRIAAGIYDAATTQRTYARLQALAHGALTAGWPVVVDAAFLRRAERNHFAELAASLALPFSIIDCRAPLALLRERLQRRQTTGGNASEADLEVLERLRTSHEPLDVPELRTALVVDSLQPPEASVLARQWLAVTTSAGSSADPPAHDRRGG